MPSQFASLVSAVLDEFREGVAVFDSDGRLVYANSAARAALERMDRADGLLTALVRQGARIKPLRTAGHDVGQAVFLAAPSVERQTLAEQERRAILHTLEATGWRLTESARRLGISRTTLWRRLKTYGLRRDGHGGRSSRS